MKLILHIGVSKTGTTALQDWLASDPSVYPKNIYYPCNQSLYGTCRGNHRLLPLLSGAALVWKTDFASQLLPQLIGSQDTSNQEAISKSIKQHIRNCIEDAIAQKCDTILMSNEHLSDRLNTQDIRYFSDQTIDLFETRDLIIYLREQKAALLSLYAESIKHGSTDEFEKFVEHNQVAQLTFDYKRIIQDWSSCGWNIVPRVYYEPGDRQGWSLFADFVSLIDNATPTESTKLNNSSLNRSPSKDSLELLRRLNYLRGNVPDSLFFFLKRQLVNLKKRRLFSSNQYAASSRKIDNRYALDNQWIAQTYFNRRALFTA